MKKNFISILSRIADWIFGTNTVECEKHSWVRLANGKWCEKCHKTEEYR
jgi:hypothetical protein